MSDIDIRLPCGFKLKFYDFYSKNDIFECPFCTKHDIDKDQCLKMERNKLVMMKKNSLSKKIKFEECIKKFDLYKKDPKLQFDETYRHLENKIDLRREEIKLMINQQIDDHYEVLRQQIEEEKDQKFEEIMVKINQIEFIQEEIDNLEIENNLKLDLYKEFNSEYDIGINFIKNIVDDLTQVNFELEPIGICENVTTSFGELYLKEKTIILLDKEDIDDDCRSQATIQLVINDFSKLKDKENFEVDSENCMIRNLKWSSSVRFKNKKLQMGISVLGLTEKTQTVYATISFTIVHQVYQKKNYTKSFCYTFNLTKIAYGLEEFIELDKIMDPQNNFYNIKEDCIILETNIKAKLVKEDK